MTVFSMVLCGYDAHIEQFLKELQNEIPYKVYWKNILDLRTELKIETTRDVDKVQVEQFAIKWVPRIQTGITLDEMVT